MRVDEEHFTPEELAKTRKLHPDTIRKLFRDEHGVLLIGHPSSRKKRQYFTMRIPASVAERVFARMTIRRSGR